MKKILAAATLIATLAGTAMPAMATETTAQVTTTATAADTQVTTNTQTAPDAQATTTQTTTGTQTTTQTATDTTTATDTQTTAEAAADAVATADVDLPDVSLTPDRLFYFLKVWVEDVRVALTRDAAARASLLEEQAQVRLAEAVKMAEEGETDLAEAALAEAQAKLAEASEQIAVAADAGKDLTSLVERIEADQSRFAGAVQAMLADLPEETREALEPLTADLLAQVALTQDAAEPDEEIAEEAEEVAAEAGLEEELAELQPRMVLVLKAMAEASGKDLAEVYAMYSENPGLGRIARELKLKMGPVQHAAQLNWKQAKDDSEEEGAAPVATDAVAPADATVGTAVDEQAKAADKVTGASKEKDPKDKAQKSDQGSAKNADRGQGKK